MIKTSSELQKILSERCASEPIEHVAKSLEIAEVYLLQMVSGHRDISKKVAKRMGYDLVPQPKPERLFIAAI